MRKFIFFTFLTILFSGLTMNSRGQTTDLFFSEYGEGSSNNKYLEIYNGTGDVVDLSIYTVKLGSNGNPWGNTLELTGSLADNSVYVIANSSANQTILNLADITSNVTWFNGDDALGLFKNDVLIDVIGVEGEDPGSYWPVAGVPDGTKEHTLVRKDDVCSPTIDWSASAGTNADDSQWIVYPQDTWDYLGSHTANCGGTSTVSIPVFNPQPGNFFAPFDLTITCSTEDATIYYTTDGTDPDQTSPVYSAPINISETTTVKARAYKDGYNPSSIATGTFTFETQVATLAELRNGTIGAPYYLTGEVILTYQQLWRSQKFIQDATAAILIDDDSGIITTDYEIWDGITGIKGILTEYGNMLQFVPSEDPGDPTSSGNIITPEIITIAQMNANFEEYESELMKIEDITFTDGGSDFTHGEVYEITDNSDATGYFRTTFYDADYLYTTIPVVPTDITGICNSRSDGDYITSRFSDDIEPSSFDPTIIVISPNGDEFWQQGSTHDIVWSSINFTGNVEIEIFKPPFTNISLASDIINTGTWEWFIPEDFTTAGTYKIRVLGMETGDPSDESDGVFSIVEAQSFPDIVINEIMYNPSTSLGSDDYFEYLELYNNSGFDVDLSGCYFSSGIEHTFVSGTSILDGEYLVLARNADSIIEYYGISNVIQWDGNNLVNSGELVELTSENDIVIDAVEYSDSNPWPTEPDGYGPSLELLDPDLDNSLPESWAASIVDNGTPGAQNSVFGLEILTLLAPNGGEIFEQGSSQEIIWTYFNFTGNIKIELITGADNREVLAENVPVTDGQWDWEIPTDQTTGDNYKIKISDMDDGEPFDESDGVFSIVSEIIPLITVVSPNGGEVWAQGTTHDIIWTVENFVGDVKIELSDGSKVITLLEDSIPATNGNWTWNIPALQAVGSNYTIIVSGMEAGGPSDESDAPFSIIQPVSAYNIVINEIMYNPSENLGNDGDFEYLELYNNEGFAVDLTGWNFTNGIDYKFQGKYILDAGAYIVVAIKPDSIIDHYGITNVVGPFSGGLSNGGELVRLVDETGVIADEVEYNDGAPWPSEPDGNGPSLELINPSLDNALPENWAASIVINGTPGIQNSVYVGDESLIVVSPNGGEQWEQGSSHDITWTYVEFSGNIKIELITASKEREVLADNVPVTDLNWTWNIPIDQTLGDAFLIKISDVDDGVPMDESDGVFSTIEPVTLPNLVINEIMYNSPGTDEEWIELYNAETENIDLEGYYILDDDPGHDPIVLPAGMNIPAGGYFTIEVATGGVFPFVPDYDGSGNFSLNNSGDEVNLYHPSGLLVDFVAYDNEPPWPTEPDGQGPTLSLLDPALDNSLPESWAASLQDGGTPGAINFTTEPVLTVVTPNGGEYIEQGSFYDITWTYLNFEGNIKIELITASKEREVLADNVPVTDLSWTWNIPIDQTLGDAFLIKISNVEDGDPWDESDNVFSIVPPAELPHIVITEIMYNPPESGTDTTEFIELYNNDVYSVNLENWYFSEGFTFIFPDININPGEYLLIAYDADAMMNTYGVTALKWTSGGLSNSGEDIKLRNATNQLIDSVDYDDGGAWPKAADGYGPSLTLCDPSSDNSLPENWSTSTEFVFVNPDGIAVYATPGAGCSEIPGQGILLSDSWGGVSSYINPADPLVENLFEYIVNDLVILQDFSNIYWPAYSVNTIVNWDSHVGYQLKMISDKYFVVSGDYETNKTISLSTGWNNLSVISTCAVSSNELFGAVTEIIFVKEMGSNLVYWPDGGIFNLEYLYPGKAYFIKVSANVNITFPECSVKDIIVPAKQKMINKTSWNDVTISSASHTIGFSLNALSKLQPGDIIGAFTINGFCAGMVEVSDKNTGLMVWGDDITTEQIDGFAEEEIMNFMVYRPATGEEFSIIPVFDNNFTESGLFTTHGISFVSDLKFGATEIADTKNLSVEIYPNPTTGLLNISTCGTDFNTLEIYSMVGQLILTVNLKESNTQIDLNNLKKGVYFFRLINSNSGKQFTKEVIIY